MIFFLNFIPLFSLILCLIKFNNNNKRHFLKNRHRKEFEIGKESKCYSILQLSNSTRKRQRYFKIAVQTLEAGDFFTIFLRFLSILGSFSYNNFSYGKTVY